MKRALALVLLASLLFVLPGGTQAAPGDAARVRAMINRLESTTVNLDLEEASLDDVLKHIQRFTGVNIIVGPKLREGVASGELSYTLQLKKVSARNALRILLEFKDLGLVFRHGVLMVTTKEDARGKPVLKIYAISDLTFQIRDFPGPDMQLRPSGSELDIEEEESTREDPFTDPEFIADIIKSNIEPDSWEAENVSIQATQRMLLVRQSPVVHAKISRLLALLRAYK